MKESASITKLAEALAKAHAEIRTIAKDRTNPHFKNRYATLDAIMDAIRPILAKYGLSVLQGASETVDGFNITTRLLHSSGEFIENVVPVPVSKQDAQGVGSALTYGRRYGVSALLSLATDEDDDGQQAAKAKPEPKKPEPKPEAKAEAKAESKDAAKYDGSMEGAMTFPFPQKGEHHNKPMGEVPVEIVRAARDAAHKADATKYADFIARADKVLAFAKGAES